MVGGGGIFFYIPQNINRWINDIDENLISVYLALRDHGDAFIQQCRGIQKEQPNEPLIATKDGGRVLYNKRLKDTFDQLIASNDQALKYFFINRTVWAGRVNYDIPSRMYFSNPSGWNIVFTDKMEKAAQIVRNTKITTGSYEIPLLEDGKNVLVYIDPPYFVNTELTNTSRLYKYNFEKNDHDRLRELVKTTKHKVVISYDNHPYIRNLYKDFNLSEDQWIYSGTSNKTKSIGKELIITNY